MTRAGDNITNFAHTSSLVSDHFLVSIELNIKNTSSESGASLFRKIGKIDLDKFKQDIRIRLNPSIEDLDMLVDHFQTTMKSILDSHAPEQQRRGKSKPIQPWYDDETHLAKRKRRSAERMWKINPLDPAAIDHLKAETCKYNQMIQEKKTDFNKEQVTTNAGNSKVLFRLVNNMLNKTNSTIYPEAPNNKALADEFSTFFKNKINKISSSFRETKEQSRTSLPDEPHAFRRFHPFGL